MKDQQQLLFTHSPPPTNAPVVPKQDRAVRALKIALLTSGAIPAVASALIFLWATAGEAILKEPYRFSTFLGKRLGGVKNAEIEASLPKETQKQETLAAASSLVELRKSCQSLRNQMAQQVYSGCIQQGGILTACEFQQSEVMKLPCNHFIPSDLSQKLHDVQGGSHD